MYRETRCVCDNGQEGVDVGNQADTESRAAASPRTIPYPLDRSQSDVTPDGMANGTSSLNGHHIPDCLQRRR